MGIDVRASFTYLDPADLKVTPTLSPFRTARRVGEVSQSQNAGMSQGLIAQRFVLVQEG